MKKKSKTFQVLAGIAFVLVLIGIFAFVFRCAGSKQKEPVPYGIVFDTEEIIA